MNQPPSYCPYCGASVEGVDSPMHSRVETLMVYRCESCDDYVFYNPTPGGSAVVVNGDALLLVEDFRASGEWKLPSGRIELGESMREGVARELEEETGLVVDPDDLVYVHDEAGEPVPDQHMVNVEYAVPRSKTSGTLEAGSDATDARFFTPDEFESSSFILRESHVDRFGDESLPWLMEEARSALELQSNASR
ncbi:NUDIX domain-containing protein [Natronosalvus caseinilyticus]|uniref:NUDIX domain-containing protein n=1 Tax=Natronosalvus caseinilyticus TaxID=2953747 RepID=UPI0028AD884A|nr:NUDIX domain-containing protein [Natronosalvus caseinilyticus]